MRLLLSVLVLSVSLVAACSSDEPKKPDPVLQTDAGGTGVAVAVVDAGALQGAPDAGAATLDAGASGAAAVDAGAPVDENAEISSSGILPEHGPARATTFDRVLAKPKDTTLSQDEVKKRVEKATGKKVELVRKSARTWLLFQFIPTSPPRGDAEQRKLIDTMRDTGLFEKIEGDRMMKVK